MYQEAGTSRRNETKYCATSHEGSTAFQENTTLSRSPRVRDYYILNWKWKSQPCVSNIRNISYVLS